MPDLDEAIEGLVAAVKETEEYKNYERERMRVSRFPELKAQIDEYRNLNYQLQNSTDDGELLYKLDAFEEEYERFRDDPLVSDFLKAELAFCRLMQDIDIRITAGLDFDL